ncbi:Spx/MgsR family transcriptional regulator|uniref:Spx/MgsR family transcriptional regulator n=1 Tax=Brenneria salicis ATCC 15712 = DSM 30166 TaxID=714314 RepID=A0A366ICS2_9GAMM|nr:ArsC family reductase [Brenneria salicis]NMN92257.1 Spx/MgsR family transcriptional regulator [Brenneria salicis ATCC 15712 = DSM 30166]RBP67594.1 Spx/MgsR family transcriptional regulator [Brenneria salicis ATCC 15712 = DSM 30166]RLM32420.1 ArsC family reductase [Brenneria salicis ATCC 15712 = DSM 30166]
MTLNMYGIKNCDTIKKARRWLEEQQIVYHFHDYRADGLDDTRLQHFIDLIGWQPLINTRGTTWRKLSEAQRDLISSNTEQSEAAAKALMLEQPAVIKRPLLVAKNEKTLLGFSAESYQEFIAENK